MDRKTFCWCWDEYHDLINVWSHLVSAAVKIANHSYLNLGKTPKIALLKHKFADLALRVFEITKMTLHILEFLVSRPPEPPPKIQILSTTRDLFQHLDTYSNCLPLFDFNYRVWTLIHRRSG